MTTREVVLEGGSPWGFRIHGGVDAKTPLRISKVNSTSKAASKGIREGQFITSINDHPTKTLTHSDAHALIKHSGDTLKLLLTEDNGSSKQRKWNRATIHETHSETLKSTSKTQYSRSSSKTVFSDEFQEPELTEQLSIEGCNNNSKEYPEAPLSPNSTASSDVSSSSTLTEAGPIDYEMADRPTCSKSKKKRRPKNQRKKMKKPQETETLEKAVYKVDFPELANSKSKLKVKSKSLDDEDSVKIQDITDTCDGKKNECQVTVSAVDQDWEEITELETLFESAVAISIDNEPIRKLESISPEEERSLRNFLQGINLVDTPINTNPDQVKREEIKKRDALAKYFTPLSTNPRYLDIISEEGSDLSDKESPSLTCHLKQGTPEVVPSDNQQKDNKPVLVCTKILDTPTVIEHLVYATETSETEKVFLDSSGESLSSKNSSDSEDHYGEHTRDNEIKSQNHAHCELPNDYNELTPPLTPQSSPKTKLSAKNSLDLEEFVEEISTESAKEITMVINKLAQERNSVVISRSSSKSSSSSRATSPSTVKLNPLNSSIADVLSIQSDLELAKEFLAFKQPISLRQFCLNCLLSLPCGAEILQELSDLSFDIDKLTLSGLTSNKSLEAISEINNASISASNMWTGIPFKSNPKILLYLSPSQKALMDKSKTLSEEPDILFDLHTKYIERNKSNATETTICEKPFHTLPRNFKQNSNNLRLEASSLNEWLQIARDDGTMDKDYQQQMHLIAEKEKEIERELEQLVEEKRKLFLEIKESEEKKFNIDNSSNTLPKNLPPLTENFRQQMYEEYMKQVTEREERKHQKVIKLSSSKDQLREEHPKLPATHITGIEDEFMKKVQERHGEPSKTTEKQESPENSESESVLIIDGKSLAQTTDLPKHLQEFLEIANTAESSENRVWCPGQNQEYLPPETKDHQKQTNESIPAVWQPKSATSSPSVERKEFRPIGFESPKLSRKNKSDEVLKKPEKSTTTSSFQQFTNHEKRIPNSQSSPNTGFDHCFTPTLPKAQNPTITLLQKAREGQLPRGANYLESNRDHYRIPQYQANKVETHDSRKVDYYSESEHETPFTIAANRRTFEGVGPISHDGMPLSLRSEVKNTDQSKWYKKMYDTIHKQKPFKDEYVTVRYKQHRAQYPYITGYLSEPEPGNYDSDYMDQKYATLDRRRTPLNGKENFVSSTMPRNLHSKTTSSSDIRNSKSNPGRIENYSPGHSSISEQESKRWWDEVMDIFDGKFEEEKKSTPKGYISQALKESGYESDSTLVFRRKEDGCQLSPSEQKQAYKIIQKGGDIPLHGLRKIVPERSKEPEPPAPPPKGQHGQQEPQQGSPRKYVENQVTIHYKAPIRQEVKDYFSEDELAHRQQEAMRRSYQEERQRKYFQELQDIHKRRHTDNFIPSEKSPIALNRYDDFDDLISIKQRVQQKTPEPRIVARALYNFVGMTPRELTFKKGDNIYVRRQIDKNWYEGELNAMVGLFPVNYVEIVPYENVRTTPRKPHEGQARAKYNFLAKTHLELSLAKGEMVIITRRVDNNWYEGKIGGRRGIFPASYVDVLIDPQEPAKESPKPIATPAAHSLLLNGTSARESMGSHTYLPNLTNSDVNPSKYYTSPIQMSRSTEIPSEDRTNIRQALHIDTQTAKPTSYKALYKYLPQNDDELELLEGDKVFVLEKCDDGWYVGSNQRTGAFGTFPGNYVDRA